MKIFSYILLALSVLGAAALTFMLRENLSYSLRSGPPRPIKSPKDLKDNSFSSIEGTAEKVIKVNRKGTILYLIPIRKDGFDLFVLRFREPAVKGKSYTFSGRLMKARKGTFPGEVLRIAGIKDEPWVLVDGVKPQKGVFYVFVSGMAFLALLMGSILHLIRRTS